MNKESGQLTDKDLAGVSGGDNVIIMPTATIVIVPEEKIVVTKPKPIKR